MCERGLDVKSKRYLSITLVNKELSLSLSVCLCLCQSLSLSVSVSVCLSLSVSLFLLKCCSLACAYAACKIAYIFDIPNSTSVVVAWRLLIVTLAKPVTFLICIVDDLAVKITRDTHGVRKMCSLADHFQRVSCDKANPTFIWTVKYWRQTLKK